jgi:DNA-directed RNA polymerase specialized sigma24 family protein
LKKLEYEKLNKSQQIIAKDWFEYAMKLTEIWANKHDCTWCLNELKSVAGLTITRCAFRYVPKEASFKTYLYISLVKAFKYSVMASKGFKLITKREWFTPFDTIEDFKFEEYPCEDNNENELVEFEDLINMSRLLKDRDKNILRYTFVEDMSGAEIGRKLGYTREYIRQRKRAIFKILKKIIKKEDLKLY